MRFSNQKWYYIRVSIEFAQPNYLTFPWFSRPNIYFPSLDRLFIGTQKLCICQKKHFLYCLFLLITFDFLPKNSKNFSKTPWYLPEWNFLIFRFSMIAGHLVLRNLTALKLFAVKRNEIASLLLTFLKFKLFKIKFWEASCPRGID